MRNLSELVGDQTRPGVEYVHFLLHRPPQHAFDSSEAITTFAIKAMPQFDSLEALLSTIPPGDGTPDALLARQIFQDGRRGLGDDFGEFMAFSNAKWIFDRPVAMVVVDGKEVYIPHPHYKNLIRRK